MEGVERLNLREKYDFVLENFVSAQVPSNPTILSQLDKVLGPVRCVEPAHVHKN